MLTGNKCSYLDKSTSAIHLVQLETLNFSLFNDIELFSLVTFFDYYFSLRQIDLLQTID